MKSNYKPIGKYIRLVDERNAGLKIPTLLGLSISKEFIPSVANIIGSDMENYKIIRRNQFACSLMQVRRDKKMPVALLKEMDEAIISQAYPVFEVIDPEILLPEYLMMWFSRPEFDREACFYAVGGVRGGLEWEDLCNMQLPVPAIEKQKEIVKEYHTIVDRIRLNEQLNQKLEETAQAIYKQWFVDFEFPDEEGRPYKSSGGEMVGSDIGEIPKNWDLWQINGFCDITSSKRIFYDDYVNEGVPFYRGKEITLKKQGKPIEDIIYIRKDKYRSIVDKYGKPESGDILLTAVGTLGSSYFVQQEDFYFKDGNVIWFKNFKSPGYNHLLYDFMQSKRFLELIQEITIGSTQNAITIDTIGQRQHVMPPKHIIESYCHLSKPLLECSNNRKNLGVRLESLKNLLLAELAQNRIN
jgi:Restriction endonuclease S subunits